jgi:hypothetical protein
MSASERELATRVDSLEGKLDAILSLLQGQAPPVAPADTIHDVDLSEYGSEELPPMAGYSTEQGGEPERGNKPTPMVKQEGLVNPVPYSPPPAFRPTTRAQDGTPLPSPAVLNDDALRAKFEQEFLNPLRAVGKNQNTRPAGYELD